MGAAVAAKRSSIAVEETGGAAAEVRAAATAPSRTRSGAGTASVTSVGIPLPPPPRPPLEVGDIEQTSLPLPPHRAPHTSSPHSTVDSLSESGTSINDSVSEESAAVDMTRRELVEKCLRSLEGGFGVAFERGKQLLDRVQEIECSPGKTLISARQTAVGVFIVKEGELEVLSPGADAVTLCCLGVGDFCGELSSFFRIPCTATVRVKQGLSTRVLLLPSLALSQNSHAEQVPMHRLLKWCTQRSYVSTGDMFDKARSSLLSIAQIETCLKAPKSLFSTWSSEAINYIATKSTPLLFSSGDVLYEAGEKLSLYFLILRGSVEFSGGSTRSSSLTVKSSSEGCYIGHAGTRMTHTATATSPLLAAPITADLLEDTVNQFPSDAAKLKNIKTGAT